MSVSTLLRGSSTSVLDLVIKVLITLIITPAMVKNLTLEGYGLWVLITSIMGYGTLLDLGITFSASRFLGMAVGQGNEGQQKLIFSTVGGYFRFIAKLLFLLTPVIVLGGGLAISGAQHADFQLAMFIMCATLILRFRFRIPLVFLRANGRYDLIALASIIRSCLQAGLLLWMLETRPSVIGVAVIQAVMECLELFLLFRFSRSLIPAGKPVVETAEIKEQRTSLFRYARSISILMVGESLRSNLNPLVVDRVSGLSSVPIYSIGMRLITILQDMVGAIFGGPIMSVFSQLHGAGDHEQLKKTFVQCLRGSSTFSVFAVLGASWLAAPFFHRWVGPELWKATDVLQIVAFPYLLYFAQYPAHNLLYTLDRNHWLSWLALAGGVFSAVFSIILGSVWGLNGVVFAMALEMLLTRVVMVPLMVSKVIRMSAGEYLFKHVLISCLRSCVPCLIGMWAFHRFAQPDYGSLFIAGSGYVAVCAVLLPFFVLQKKERTALASLLKRRLGFRG